MYVCNETISSPHSLSSFYSSQWPCAGSMLNRDLSVAVLTAGNTGSYPGNGLTTNVTDSNGYAYGLRRSSRCSTALRDTLASLRTKKCLITWEYPSATSYPNLCIEIYI